MAGETTLTIVGNLTADPELRFTPSGHAVANFTVASTHMRRIQPLPTQNRTLFTIRRILILRDDRQLVGREAYS